MRLFAIVFVLLGLPVAALGDAPPAPHLELDIALDPAMRQLTATADLSVDSDMLQFALAPGLRMTRLLVDGRPRDLPAAADGRVHPKLGGLGPHRIQLDYGGRLAPSEPPYVRCYERDDGDF